MTRDEHNNLIATEAEWNADLRGILQQAFSEHVGVRVLDEQGNIVWAVSGPLRVLPEPEREQLRDAVIGCAQRFHSCHWEDAAEAEAALFAAVDALEAHERKAGGQ